MSTDENNCPMIIADNKHTEENNHNAEVLNLEDVNDGSPNLRVENSS